MAKAKVKVGMYQATRWNDDYEVGTSISKEEYDRLVENKILDYGSDDSRFEEYLCKKYSMIEIFEMNQSEKQGVEQDYEEECKEDVLYEMDKQWEYVEFETEVEIPNAEIVVCGCPCPKRR